MSYPVNFTADYPEKFSRGSTVIQALFGWLYAGIPHSIVLYLYGIAAGIVTFIAFFAILFTGKYPKGMYDFVVAYQRWSNNVTTYLLLLHNRYPPFSGSEQRTTSSGVSQPS